MEPPIPEIKRSVWDYLFYLCMSIVLLWVVLKSIGIIKTPFWLEYGLPVASFVIGFLTFSQSLNNRISKLEASDARIEAILKHHDRDLEKIKDRLQMT